MARKSTDTVAITLRIREDLRRRLERQAKKNDTSLNTEMEARLQSSFDLTNTASLIRVLSGGEFMADLLGAIAKVFDLGGEWKKHPEKSVANKVQIEAAYTALIIIFTELFSTPERQLDPGPAGEVIATMRGRGSGEASVPQMEGVIMANNVLRKLELMSLLEPTEVERKHGLIPTDSDLLERGLLRFPKRKNPKDKTND